MSEKMTTANSAEQGKVDIDFAECAVPKWSRRRFVTMFMIMLGFTFFSASMWVGQEMAAGLDFWGSSGDGGQAGDADPASGVSVGRPRTPFG